jgi:hypothetical protein
MKRVVPRGRRIVLRRRFGDPSRRQLSCGRATRLRLRHVTSTAVALFASARSLNVGLGVADAAGATNSHASSAAPSFTGGRTARP